MQHPDQPEKPISKSAEAANLNPRFKEQVQKRSKKMHSVSTYVEGILRGDRVLLGQAITLIESTRPDYLALGEAIIEQCLPYSGQSLRIGITGTPGVGKSTFIETFGQYALKSDHKIAVLAIDPSSPVNKGSILGDKTRMAQLSNHPNAFIRPSPSGQNIGGVARKTREAMLLCEAAGYNLILVETVGVGQSGVAVHSMVDFFLLLLLPGAGDELQGIKRGIVEMADLIAINKADGDRIKSANLAKRAYQNALHLYPPKNSQWTPKVVTCSALQIEEMEKIWQIINDFRHFTTQNNYFPQHRKEQAKYWFYESIQARMEDLFYQHPEIRQQLPLIEAQVYNEQKSSFKAANDLIQLFLKSLKKDDFSEESSS